LKNLALETESKAGAIRMTELRLNTTVFLLDAAQNAKPSDAENPDVARALETKMKKEEEEAKEGAKQVADLQRQLRELEQSNKDKQQRLDQFRDAYLTVAKADPTATDSALKTQIEREKEEAAKKATADTIESKKKCALI